MSQPIVLITGASSGIGLATAQYLSQRGFFVYATARRLERLEPLRSASLEPLRLDVTDPASVHPAVKQIQQRSGRIDILINNAGYAQYGVAEESRWWEATRQFDVNVLGLMRVTQAVLPLMREQRGGTIVNMSSVAGKMSTPFAGWYAASKHAVEALSDALRLEVQPFGIRVILIEPGAIKTEFDDIAVSELQKYASLEAYRPRVAAFTRLVQNSYRTAPGPDLIAQTIYQAVNSRTPRARYVVPYASKVLVWLRRTLSDRLFDRLIGSQMRG